MHASSRAMRENRSLSTRSRRPSLWPAALDKLNQSRESAAPAEHWAARARQDGEGAGCTLRLSGYCAATPAELLTTALNGGDWTRLGGDFVLVASAPDDVHLVSSTLAAFPYFYAVDRAGRFLHDANVFRLARSLNEPWQWSQRALRCLALFGHTLGADTLHSRIFRVPPAAHLYWNGESLRQLACRLPSTWLDQPPSPTSDEPLQESTEALEQAFLSLPQGPLVLSLSAGFDSRLLLALSLRYRRPSRAISLGHSNSTDVEIAKQLAHRVGLPLTTVQLEPEDYAKASAEAVWRTGGSKTAANWHTLIYPKLSGVSAQEVHLVGSNGEFARTYLLGGGLSRFAELPDESAGLSWLARLAKERLRLHPTWQFLSPTQLARSLGDVRYALRLIPPQANLADRLDLFYALLRVRHFIGNGLALYAANGQPCSPFLDGRWIETTLRIPRRHKLNGYYHRFIIQQLAPDLVSYPFNGCSFQSLASPPQWVSPFRGYGAFDRAIQAPELRERLIEDSRMDQFLPRSARSEVMRRGQQRDVSLLWTLSVASDWADWVVSDRPEPSFDAQPMTLE